MDGVLKVRQSGMSWLFMVELKICMDLLLPSIFIFVYDLLLEFKHLIYTLYFFGGFFSNLDVDL